MATVSSTGVGSGLDVNKIVTSLMTLERRPLSLLEDQASSIQTKLSAFGSLKGQTSALGDVVTRLAEPANWAPLRMDSSDAASVAGTISAAAQTGRHVVQVQQLAQGQALASTPYALSTTVVGTGTLTLETGTTVGSVFTPVAGGSPVVITIGDGAKTLAGIRDAINAAQASVTASIVTSGAGSQLVLRTADGASSSVRLIASDDDGNNTDTAGLSALAWDPAASAGAGRNLAQTQPALDAQFTLDSLGLTSASNSPQGLMDGLTLTFKRVTTSPVEISVTTDTAAVRRNVDDFVGTYNSLNQLVKAQLKSDGTSTGRGPLQADATALSLLTALRASIGGSVTGLTGPSSLNAAGIELQRDGSLKVNESRLTPLLGTPAKLSQLFSQAESGGDPGTRGIALRLRQWTAAMTGDTGVLTSRRQGLEHSLQAVQRREDDENAKLARTEARLRAQYQRLDSVMSRLNSQLQQVTAAFGTKS